MRVQPGDEAVNHGDRVAAVRLRALGASRLPGPVPGEDRPGLPARGARFGPLLAGRAVPVLAAALEGPQLLAALRAARRRDRPRAGLAQRHEQVADGPGRRGAAVGQHCGTSCQSRGKTARLGAPARDSGDYRTDLLSGELVLNCRNHVHDQPDRVGYGPLRPPGADHGRPAP